MGSELSCCFFFSFFLREFFSRALLSERREQAIHFSTYPMVDPQIANPCGHPVCGHCADQLVKNGVKNCHICRQPRLGFNCRNIFVQQLLGNVKATCKSCSQEVALNEVETPVTKDCGEIEVPCGQCQASIKRRTTQSTMEVAQRAR